MGLKSKDNTLIHNPSAKADGKETCNEISHSKDNTLIHNPSAKADGKETCNEISHCSAV